MYLLQVLQNLLVKRFVFDRADNHWADNIETMKTHNNLLHSPICFNPWIPGNQQVKEFANYGETGKKILKPESFGLYNYGSRRCKLLDLLEENGFKPLTVLKDDPGFKSKLVHLLQTQNTIGRIQKTEPMFMSDFNWSQIPL